MLISESHLKIVTERNIHLVRWPNNPDHLDSVVRGAAQTLSYHLAELRGEQLSTERDVLLELATKFDFPKYAGPGHEEMNWNSANDSLGDLEWILKGTSDSGERPDAPAMRGVVAVLRNPEHLLKADPIQFAFLVDALGRQSRRLLKLWIPFHVVIGPLPEDYRYECFMNILSASSYFCEACQMVDG